METFKEIHFTRLIKKLNRLIVGRGYVRLKF